MSERQRFGRGRRLKHADIVALLSGGQITSAAGLKVSSKANALGTARLGLIVPKKVLSRAVDRSRARRVIREWFRRTQGQLGGRDFLLRVTKADFTLADIEKRLSETP